MLDLFDSPTPTSSVDSPMPKTLRKMRRALKAKGVSPDEHRPAPYTALPRPPRKVRSAEPPKACGHTGCELVTPDGCCECLDTRPSRNGYMRYVDGEGWQSGALRSAGYCSYCQKYPISSYNRSPAPGTSLLPASPAELAPVMPSASSRPSPKKSISAPLSKTCGHDHCDLSIPTCCSCTDNRPYSETYPLYIDGQGDTSEGKRWSMYCSPCRDFYESLSLLKGQVGELVNEISVRNEPEKSEALQGGEFKSDAVPTIIVYGGDDVEGQEASLDEGDGSDYILVDKPSLLLSQSEKVSGERASLIRGESIASETFTPQSSPSSTTANPSPIQEIGATSPENHPVHATILPTFEITLDQALNIDFELRDPMECIDADAQHVNFIVQDLLTWPQYAEIPHANFTGSNMIYRRLIIYIFAHLALCCSQKSLLDQFRETLKLWKTWNNITVIQNHQSIKDHLWDLFRQGLNIESTSTLHPEETFHKLVALDVIGLYAQLTIMVTDNTKYKELLAQRGRAAQALLNLLQTRLDFPMESRYKPRHVKALLKLSRASGLYPECLALKGIEMERHPVDSGGYGDVYKGMLRGRAIAVKALKIYQTSDLTALLKEFSSEAVLWRQLSHPNVLPFYGIYHPDENLPRLCLTAPWMENGNVVEFLKRYPDTYCIHLASDMALGLAYLHGLTPGIVHGDLKGANVLVTQSRRACLADFGLATAIDSNTIAMTHKSTVRTGGTVRWQAPELFDPSVYQQNSKASDIYALACVYYELFSGQVPFPEFQNDYAVLVSVMRGKRPDFPSHDLCRSRGLDNEVWDLMQTCWAQEPIQRPTVEQVMARLQALPHQVADQRPLDDFNINFPSQTAYIHTDHLFSALAKQTSLGSGLAITEHTPLGSEPTTAEQTPLLSAVSTAAQESLASVLDMALSDNTVPNVVIFGEGGAGKSSVVNMIAGRQVAQTSNHAVDYMFQSESHFVDIGGTPVRLWDTTGLNEEDTGLDITKDIIIHLFNLLKRLEDGINLLVYCVRGPRVKSSTIRNYRMFYHCMCQQNVPIILVATGLEGEDPMDAWWPMNKDVFQRQQMFFSGQTCITATRGKLRRGAYMFEPEYEESKAKVQKLIGDCCRDAQGTAWKMQPAQWTVSTAKNASNRVTGLFNAPPPGFNDLLAEVLKEHGGSSDEEARKIAMGVENGA